MALDSTRPCEMWRSWQAREVCRGGMRRPDADVSTLGVSHQMPAPRSKFRGSCRPVSHHMVLDAQSLLFKKCKLLSRDFTSVEKASCVVQKPGLAMGWLEGMDVGFWCPRKGCLAGSLLICAPQHTRRF